MTSIFQRTTPNVEVTEYFYSPYSQFRGDLCCPIDEDLLSKTLSLAYLVRDTDSRTSEFANVGIGQTDLLDSSFDFATAMALQYRYMLAGGSQAEFTIDGAYTGRTPTGVNRWAYTGNLSIEPVANTTPEAGLVADSKGLPVQSYNLQTSGQIVADAGYQAYTCRVSASLEQRSPRPINTSQAGVIIHHGFLGAEGQQVRFAGTAIEYPSGEVESNPFMPNFYISDRRTTVGISDTEVYDYSTGTTLAIAGVEGAFRSHFGWVFLTGGNLIRANGQTFQDFGGDATAVQRFNFEVWLTTSNQIFKLEPSVGSFKQRGLPAPFNSSPVGLFLISNVLHYVSLAGGGSTLEIYAVDGTQLASVALPRAMSAVTFLHTAGYTAAGVTFTLQDDTGSVWVNLRPNFTPGAPDYDVTTGSGAAFPNGREVSIVGDVIPVADFPETLDAIPDRYSVDMRVYSKRSDSPPFSPLALTLDTDNALHQNDDQFLIYFEGTIYRGSHDLLRADTRAETGIIQPPTVSIPRSLVFRNNLPYAVLVITTPARGSWINVNNPTQGYVQQVVMTPLEIVGNTTETLNHVRLPINPASLTEFNGEHLELSTAGALTDTDGWLLYQTGQRSTFEFNPSFYQDFSKFDFKCWTTWDLPVYLRVHEANKTILPFLESYASTGLVPSAIETILGLEGDSTDFNVPAHSMFEDSTEVDLGVDPSVFIVSNPVAVVQDVRVYLNGWFSTLRSN